MIGMDGLDGMDLFTKDWEQISKDCVFCREIVLELVARTLCSPPLIKMTKHKERLQ